MKLFKIATLSFVFMQATSLSTMANHHGAGSHASYPSMVWTYHQFNDPMNKGRTTSQFQVGIPETDNIVAHGSCAVGLGGNFSKVIFGAAIPAHQIGEALTVTLNTSSGHLKRRGLAIGADLEEGISGVELIIDNDDVIWRSLSNMNSVTYNIVGQTYTLPLRGSGNTISKFLQDCNFYANKFTNQLDSVQELENPVVIKEDMSLDSLVDPLGDPRLASCDLLQNKVSKRSDFSVRMTVVNKTNSHRAVMWIDFEGNPKEYASLEAGEKYTIKTYITHPWMFTDGPGNCLEMFMPHQGVDTFNITAPNRDFGPE